MEYTITYNAQITEIIHGGPEVEEQFLDPKMPALIAEAIKKELDVDDVNVADLKVFIGGAV